MREQGGVLSCLLKKLNVFLGLFDIGVTIVVQYLCNMFESLFIAYLVGWFLTLYIV